MGNKKSELLTLGILLVVGIIIVSGMLINDANSKTPVYIGDKTTHNVYNIKSTNPNCNINNITIDSENIVHFDNIPNDYSLDNNCN